MDDKQDNESELHRYREMQRRAGQDNAMTLIGLTVSMLFLIFLYRC